MPKPAGSRAPSTGNRAQPLFVVHTSAGTITDLGTEFGVEVQQSGLVRAEVYEGQVRLELAQHDGSHAPYAATLNANQSAHMRRGQPSEIEVARRSTALSGFVREVPKRVRIKTFNTSVGLHQGQADPHWQVIARSDQPLFPPSSPVVLAVNQQYLQFLPNNPYRSQWISLGQSLFPDKVRYRFATTFDLTGHLPETAFLRGRFLVDNQILQVRLNDHDLIVPDQSRQDTKDHWLGFQTAKGFVPGVNRLEFEVFNGSADGYRECAMALRVELEVSALPQWAISAKPLQEQP